MPIHTHLRRLVSAIRSNWPKTRILIRGDGHDRGPLVIDWRRANGIDFILGVAPTSTLRRHVATIEGQHDRALHGVGRGRRTQGPALHGVLRRGRQLEPDRAHHRPRRGRPAGCRYPLHRHQSRKRQGEGALRRGLLPARNGREPYQIMEDAPRRRPHLVHASDGQPVPPLSPRLSLVVDVGAARRDAQALALQRRPVRHPASAPHQDRRPRRRIEDPDPPAPSSVLPGSAFPAHRPRANTRLVT